MYNFTKHGQLNVHLVIRSEAFDCITWSSSAADRVCSVVMEPQILSLGDVLPPLKRTNMSLSPSDMSLNSNYIVYSEQAKLRSKVDSPMDSITATGSIGYESHNGNQLDFPQK